MVATSPSMSSSTSDSSSAPTKISEPLPPVREETPIPVPLEVLQRRASTVSRVIGSSGHSSADEEALLQAMNSDSQVRKISKIIYSFTSTFHCFL